MRKCRACVGGAEGRAGVGEAGCAASAQRTQTTGDADLTACARTSRLPARTSAPHGCSRGPHGCARGQTVQDMARILESRTASYLLQRLGTAPRTSLKVGKLGS